MDDLSDKPGSSESGVSKDDTVLHLIRGTSTKTANDRINDPLWYVDRFRTHREQSVREVVMSAIAVCEGLATVEDNTEDFRRFMRALADSKMMSQAEAAKSKRADMPMLSKIQKIYDRREIILHASIADKLCAGYSVLYELALLIDHYIPKDDGEVTLEVLADARKHISRHLEKLDGDLTRQWIKSERESVGAIPARKVKTKPAKPGKAEARVIAPNSEPAHESDEDGPGEGVDTDEDVDEQTVSDDELPIPGEPIAAVFLSIDNQNERELCLAAEGRGWHRIAWRIADDSVFFIQAPLQSLLNTIGVNITLLGSRCAAVYPITKPDKRDLTECDVLAVFKRGADLCSGVVPTWKPEDSPIEIACRFLQDVPGRRVQLFADGLVEGWDAVTTDQA